MRACRVAAVRARDRQICRNLMNIFRWEVGVIDGDRTVNQADRDFG
jgi:hypothetical protein